MASNYVTLNVNDYILCIPEGYFDWDLRKYSDWAYLQDIFHIPGCSAWGKMVLTSCAQRALIFICVIKKIFHIEFSDPRICLLARNTKTRRHYQQWDLELFKYEMLTTGVNIIVPYDQEGCARQYIHMLTSNILLTYHNYYSGTAPY